MNIASIAGRAAIVDNQVGSSKHSYAKRTRAFSSAGERLPYKQEVGGSNPPTPTTHRAGPGPAFIS